MGIEYPSALWWSLLAIPVVLFYLSFRSRKHAVSAMFLWHRTLARRTLWQRVRPLVSLGLQLLFLFLVIAALADPFHSADQHIASGMILAATVLTVLEWILFQRRVTV